MRLICEREQEIRAFVPQEYWSLHAHLAAAVPPEFVATLREKDGVKLVPSNEAETQAIIREIEGTAAAGEDRGEGARALPFIVKAVERGERRKNPSPPFITSTLQQDAGRKLRKYASVGVPAYWIVDLARRRVEVHRQPSGRGKAAAYKQLTIHDPGEAVPVEIDGRELGRVAVSDILPPG